MPDSPKPARPVVRAGPDTDALEAEPFADWFTAFLHDRQTRKPSAHTMKAYRQDFAAIASLITDGNPARMDVVDTTKGSMRAAFSTYAQDHEAASIRRCWSTWNVLCTFLYTGEQLAANPMQRVGRPKLAKALPKALPRTAVEVLLETVAQDHDSKRQTDWAERDLAIILTAQLAGLRSEELRQANIGDIRTTDDGAAVIHVKGKGGKERGVPIESDLLAVIETYLDSRAIRFPDAEKRRAAAGSGLARWSARSPLFVGPGWPTHHAGNTAITHQTGVQTRGPRRPARPRSPGARTAPHLRHRTRELRCQRLHLDEVARTRVHDHIPALRDRCGQRNTECRGTKPSICAHLTQTRPPRSKVVSEGDSLRLDTAKNLTRRGHRPRTAAQDGEPCWPPAVRRFSSKHPVSAE